MNEKFYQLPEEKQLQIINAGYKVFAGNSYKKAPTSEIAREAGISKALLFHYFHNKQELFMYLWDGAARLTAQTTMQNQVYESRDFFEMLRRGLAAKCILMQKYPYLALFAMNAYYESDPEIRDLIGNDVRDRLDTAADQIAALVDMTKLRKDVDFKSIYRETVYASEGMMVQLYRRGRVDADVFEKEYLRMIDHWEKIYSV